MSPTHRMSETKLTERQKKTKSHQKVSDNSKHIFVGDIVFEVDRHLEWRQSGSKMNSLHSHNHQ